MKCFVLCLLLLCHNATAQQSTVALRGLSVYVEDDESAFPILQRDTVDENGKPLRPYQRLTIQFDVAASEPPQLKIRFFHCNRDWQIDENVFVTDPNHNTSFVLEFFPSPGGVRGYNYRYINRFPDDNDAVRFDYSGNWLFRIMEKDEATVYAEGRFFVVDRITPTTVTVTNDYLTAQTSPYNQIHKVSARVKLPREVDGVYYTTADVYQNRRFHQPYRIDAWDRNPYTHVEGFNTGERIFTITNILPGNEYRVLDLSDHTRYPNYTLVRLVEGADQLRLFWRTGADHDGEAILNRFTGLSSDYLEVLFRLDMLERDYRALTAGNKELFLVGEFNGWNPTEEDRLRWDEAERSYVVRKYLRRGIYDYQYITGRWDSASNTVTHQDWTAVEGNDWRTTNTYTVMVYFNDPRFGGFDRIVGIGFGSSSSPQPGSY
jgi:hypothetical protein